MNSEVLPAVRAWTETTNKTSVSWPSPPSSPGLAAPAGQSPTGRSPAGRSQAQLDLFHKLGYSTEQVLAVLRTFGPDMDTNKLLERLVKIGAEAEPPGPPAVRTNLLIPQWDVRDRGSVQVPVMPEPGPVYSHGPDETSEDEDPLRTIVIDGSNVAMSHGNKEVFSCLGIQLAVNFFLERGHKSITVFVPSWRNEKPRPDVPISDQRILRELEERKLLVFTPSKRVGGKRVVCHDDRYIVKLAFETDGLIVSNDMYRDLQRENPEWKRFIEERLIMYSFVNNKFMPPDDPMGRHGPSLDDLRHKCPVVQKKQPCPYGKKCTFGIKCRFLHPERPKQSNQSLADELRTRCSLPHTAPYTSAPAPAPGHSLSLVEDMAKKLTLGSSLKKEHTPDSPSHGKTGHSKKSCSRKDRKSRQVSLESTTGSEAPERQLDSGLGSIDPQPYDALYGSGLYSQPQSAPCSCRLPTHHQCYHHGSALSDLSLAYTAPPYSGYGAYGGTVRPYSHCPDFQHSARPPQHLYWSDPYPLAPRGVCRPPDDGSLWEPGPASTGPAGAAPEREAVRKKLLAIFSAPLVDAAMNMNPQLLDPQRLATEIVRLQSQGL